MTHQQNDILISIIFTESAASMLKMDVPPIENSNEVVGSTCILRPISRKDLKAKSSVNCGGIDEIVESEVAFFSNTFAKESDDSMSGKSEVDLQENALTTLDVYMRPLYTMKDANVNSKITLRDNNIYVYLNEDNAFNDSDAICRICHGGESIGDLHAPCRCRGSIALAHIECLERWLKESSNSYCELCQHHYQVDRKPKYNIPRSVLMYLFEPGDNFREIILDTLAFAVYTPSALVSTYMLMIICEVVSRSHLRDTRAMSAHLVALSAVFGMAAIDFTYSSWLIMTFQKHLNAWRSWYRNNCHLKLLLPEWKRRARKRNCVKAPDGSSSRTTNSK